MEQPHTQIQLLIGNKKNYAQMLIFKQLTKNTWQMLTDS